MVVPRGVRVQRETRMTSSYIAARTRERAELRFLDEKIERLKEILAIEREIAQLKSAAKTTQLSGGS